MSHCTPVSPLTCLWLCTHQCCYLYQSSDADVVQIQTDRQQTFVKGKLHESHSWISKVLVLYGRQARPYYRIFLIYVTLAFLSFHINSIENLGFWSNSVRLAPMTYCFQTLTLFQKINHNSSVGALRLNRLHGQRYTDTHVHMLRLQ